MGKTPKGILTVRFTLRQQSIRIIGAGKWRKWRKYYVGDFETAMRNKHGISG
ncbi:MAG: hypothetical protein DSM106950_39025 [Stigonema ocellatum SAG 48.90 = DSM 106950]|nr:hypothetical protein [Stigonema ocellatum SAG 48.90 = DSM 106950]